MWKSAFFLNYQHYQKPTVPRAKFPESISPVIDFCFHCFSLGCFYIHKQKRKCAGFDFPAVCLMIACFTIAHIKGSVSSKNMSDVPFGIRCYLLDLQSYFITRFTSSYRSCCCSTQPPSAARQWDVIHRHLSGRVNYTFMTNMNTTVTYSIICRTL